MSTLISLGIILTGTLFIMWPYFQKNIRHSDDPRKQRNKFLSELQESRDNLLSTIKDIEFDYEMGKLSSEDFTELKTRYRKKTIGILKEIEKRKDGYHSLKEDRVVLPTIKKKREEEWQGYCVVCGTAFERGDRFCRSCGNKLIERPD